jgi:predicted RecA/RadA family phage recombinase
MSQFGPTPSVATVQPLWARYVHGDQTVEFTPLAATNYCGNGVGNGVPFGGVIVLPGGMVGIATRPLLAGVPGSLIIRGTFDFPESATDGGMLAGSTSYWDNVNFVATNTASGNSYLGKVELTTVNGSTTVRVSVNATANGTLDGGYNRSTVAAAGSTQANATLLPYGFVKVTGANGTTGVTLPPTPAAGGVVRVVNNSASALKVWPDPAATINAIASNGAISMAANTSADFTADSPTQWFTTPLVPS